MKDPEVTEIKELEPFEIMKQVPGIDRDTLHRWRKQGYIQGRIRRIGKKPIFVYPAEEIPKISRMYELVKEGYSPHRAFERACMDLGLSANEKQQVGSAHVTEGSSSDDRGTHADDIICVSEDHRKYFEDQVKEAIKTQDLPNPADEPYVWDLCTKHVVAYLTPGKKGLVMVSTHNDPPIAIVINDNPKEIMSAAIRLLARLEKEFPDRAHNAAPRKQAKNERKGKKRTTK